MKHTSFIETAFPGNNSEPVAVRIPKSLLQEIEAEARERNSDSSTVVRDALVLLLTPRKLKSKIDAGERLDGVDQMVLVFYRRVLDSYVTLARSLGEDPDVRKLNEALANPDVQKLIAEVAKNVAERATKNH